MHLYIQFHWHRFREMIFCGIRRALHCKTLYWNITYFNCMTISSVYIFRIGPVIAYNLTTYDPGFLLIHISRLWCLLYIGQANVAPCLLLNKSFGAFAKLWEASITFFMHVCPFFRPHRTTRPPHWTDFHEILYLNNFFPPKSVVKIKILLKSDKNNGTLHKGLFTFVTSPWVLLRIRNILDESCR
jgi:hypothetical protein